MMKDKYFECRNLLRAKQDFAQLAAREISTLMNLIKLDEPGFSLSQKTLIDLGCGDRYLQPGIEAQGARYFGFDVDNCDLLSDRVDMADNSADVILSYSVIEHLSNPTNFFNEAKRLLKIDGYMIIETPNWEYCQKTFYDDYTHVKPYTPASLKAIAEDFDFYVCLLAPNVRCKPSVFYQNKLSFFMARSLPFRGFGGFFGFLKGRSTGIFLVVKKK